MSDVIEFAQIKFSCVSEIKDFITRKQKESEKLCLEARETDGRKKVRSTCEALFIQNNAAIQENEHADAKNCSKLLNIAKNWCKTGSGYGCSALFNMYMEGYCVEKSIRIAQKGSEFFENRVKKLCDDGVTEECVEYADFLVQKDSKTATSYYNLSCNKGYGEACFKLGLLNNDINLIAKACHFNDADACGYLASEMR
eukprot:TRINITY_DN7480_c0_g1_i1.p1 TRINITY_DN7480_c0_g1~~TRINITY_DN7480_c0_g1_i1.p1  ORF type:complete len:210 (-),score=32.16 TRINITY_DN7480_c0_g1_i1:64-657(-)